MIVSPVDGQASQRTRNRLRDNGPEFDIISTMSDVDSLGHVPGLLLWSKRTDWTGWVPTSEVVTDHNPRLKV